MEFNLGLDQDLINAVSQIVEASCSSKKMEKEELHPNQVKLDKNKNGKLDSDDFKKLRKEEEEIEEAKDDWSKNDSLAKPVTSGQAMANHSQYFTKVTKLDSNGNPKKPVKEESEDLTEISKKVIGSYVKKASNDLASSVHGERDAEQDDEHDAQEYHAKRAEKRMSGLERAGNKLAKEEVEELDEASIKLFMGMYQVWNKGKKIASYASKTDAQDHVNSLKEELEEGMEEFAKSQAKKRAEARKAKEKMSCEETEELDELSKTTLGSYVKKAGQHRVNLAGKEKELGDTVNGLQKAKNNMDDDNYSKVSDVQDIVSKQRNAVSDKGVARARGIHTAIKKLTKEQVEEIEALAAKHGLGE